MKCIQCGAIIPEKEAKKIEEAGEDPLCSIYCSYIYGGVPLPYGSSDGFITDVINCNLQCLQGRKTEIKEEE